MVEVRTNLNINVSQEIRLKQRNLPAQNKPHKTEITVRKPETAQFAITEETSRLSKLRIWLSANQITWIIGVEKHGL